MQIVLSSPETVDAVSRGLVAVLGALGQPLTLLGLALAVVLVLLVQQGRPSGGRLSERLRHRSDNRSRLGGASFRECPQPHRRSSWRGLSITR